MCDAASCAPCTWAPLRRGLPAKGRYNKCSTFTFKLQQKCLNKWIGSALMGTRFYNFQPPTPTQSPQTPHPKISKCKMFTSGIAPVTSLAGWPQLFQTMQYDRLFSATAGLLVIDWCQRETLGYSAMFVYIYVCLISLITYYVYRIVSWYRRIMVIGAQVDKLPGDDRHWLYGNLKDVSYFSSKRNGLGFFFIKVNL